VQRLEDGFGHNVLIQHSNGMSTLYGHGLPNLIIGGMN